jgi:hypothetical protein
MNAFIAPLRLTLTRIAVASFAALLLTVGSTSAAPAADNANLHPLSDQAAKLPLEHSFNKEKTGEYAGLYTLTLKNTSAAAVKVNVLVERSVVVHNRPKSETLPAETIKPGASMKVEVLAAHDKVTVTADGFAPLHLTVP